MSNVKKLMMSAASGGGNWYTHWGVDDHLVEGAGTVGGQTLPYGTHGGAVNKNDTLVVLSDGTTVTIKRLGGGGAAIQGLYATKFDTDGSILYQKAMYHKTGTTQTHIRFYPNGAISDSSDNIWVAGEVSYTNLTNYGSGPWPALLKLTGSNLALDEFWVYGNDQGTYNNSNRGWFEDVKINQNNGNIMCAGVTDVTGVGYIGIYYEINPSTMATIACRIVGAGGSYLNLIETDTSGNIFVGGYDNYSPTLFAKYTSSHSLSWSKPIDNNGGVPSQIRCKGTDVYILREDSGIMSATTYIPVAMNKFNSSGTNQWTTYGAHSDGANHMRPYGFDFDSNNDIIITSRAPSGWQSNLAGGSGNEGFIVAKLNDSDGDLAWATWVTPYINTGSSVNSSSFYLTEGCVIKDGRLVFGGNQRFYYYVSGSDYVITYRGFAINVPEDFSGYTFENDDLFSNPSITGKEYGIKILDATSYFTVSGPALLDSGGVSTTNVACSDEQEYDLQSSTGFLINPGPNWADLAVDFTEIVAL